MSSNAEKSRQLGMPHGTASARLRKKIMFELMKKCGMDNCYQCGDKIENIDNLSIEHKEPWLHSTNPVERFFDIDNIAFSHLKCNVNAARSTAGRRAECGTRQAYLKWGCRCPACTKANADSCREYKLRKKQD